jgi:tRNA A-37 threonylcarbamoyl transferase component Bud32
MPRLLTCPQGHQWELPEAEGGGSAVQLLCPVCGTPQIADPRPIASAETGTYHPAGANQSEAETLVPKTPPAANPSEPPEVLPEPQLSTPAPEIPGYEIVGELGRGGMGMVYKARQTKLERLVALKILPQETSADSTFAERFTREARALARLNHPNIVSVYDFGQTGTLSYFVMEYVDGVNLRQLLRAGPIAPRDVLRIMSQIGDALQYAHDEGIVHRDIKPENILRDKRGRVKIADFGIAKLLARKTTDYTLTGPWHVIGTFNYMAPEQIENPLKLDHRADIYSLGVMFYEMLTGGLPMGRFALPSQKAALDPRIDEIVLRALEKEPEHRYQHVHELKTAIDIFLVSGAGDGLGSGGRTTAGSYGDPPVPKTAPGIVRTPRSSSTATWPGEFPSAIPVGPTRERIRRGLRGPAIGLKITGLMWFCSGVVWAALSHAEMSALTIASLNLAQGIFVFLCARRMENLRSYQMVVLGCVLAMLPCFSPVVLIGLPMGIWALVVLFRPEVRAAFSRGPIPAPPVLTPAPGPAPSFRRKGVLAKMFATTTGWAMILCVLGGLRTFLPWAVQHRWEVAPGVIWTGDNNILGFESTFGLLTAMTFLLLFLLLVATGFLEPIPIWRPLSLFVAAILAILFSVLPPSVGQSLHAGAYLAIVLGVGLLFLGALQIRRILLTRRPIT